MNTFLIADTHFGHKGIATEFLRADGVTKERPFNSVEEMDETLVANWNKVVNPKDKVYHLGDVLINRRAFPILGRLNGNKVLVKGNHDCYKLDEYYRYFKDIRGSHKLDKFILTHIPIHPWSLPRWSGNIHGHTHSNVVKREVWNERESILSVEPDPRYFCVSVEQIDYTPIPFEIVKKIMKERNVA